MLIDDHVHVTRSRTTRRPDGDTFCTPDKLIEKMDADGVDKAVLLPIVSPECRNRWVTTEDCLEICAVYPDRFYTFCNLDPRMDTNNEKADFSRYLAWYKEAGCKGVGEVTANMPFDDPLVVNMLKHCEACEMPVMFHIAPRIGGTYGLYDDTGLPRMEKMLQTFPNLVFIGHSPPFWSEISGGLTDATRGGYPKTAVQPGGRLVELLERCPNLYGDLSAGSGFNAISRDPAFGYEFMDKFQDRLFFGTDICCPQNRMPHAKYLRNACEKRFISQKVFDKIAWENVDLVLKLGLGESATANVSALDTGAAGSGGRATT